MSRKQLLAIILIAFFIGAVGSIFFNRLVIPYLATVPKLTWLKNLQSTTPIIITRREEIQLNEGANLVELTKQAAAFTVSIYLPTASSFKFAGSGVILASDGLIFTSREVVGISGEVIVVTNSGSSYKGLVRALDRKSELAVVTVSTSNLPVAQFADAVSLQPGQKILALGKSEKEFNRKIATGVVTKSVLNNASLDKISSSENFEETPETNASLSSDFVGGPIINLEGKMIGLIVNGQGKILISEAIKGALTAYLEKGKITRPYLGLRYQTFSKSLAKLKDMPTAGILINSVEEGSPAGRASLLAGDLITEIDGQSLADISLEQILNNRDLSDLKLTVLREGKTIETVVKLEAR